MNIFDKDFFEAMESTTDKQDSRKIIADWKKYAYDKCYTDEELKNLCNKCWKLCCYSRFHRFNKNKSIKAYTDATEIRDEIVDYLYNDKNRPEYVDRKIVFRFVGNLISHGERYSLY